MPHPLRIYALDNLPPEVRAVTFAKCSRSPEPFYEIAKELTEEKSAQFHEKWVVAYGHSSVAEHAVLSLAIENVSILATKVIEDNRLASYTEKSTRYQIFDRDRYYKPDNIMRSPLGELYEQTGNFLMDTYQSLFPKVLDFFKKEFPRKDEPEKMYEGITTGRACDTLRYLLPTATLTNLGMTANARTLAWAIIKLISHPLQEMRDIGYALQKAGLKTAPTLIKHIQPNNYLMETAKSLCDKIKTLADNTLLDNTPRATRAKDVILVEHDARAENKLVASLLYRFSNASYEQAKQKVQKMQPEEKEQIIDEALKRRDKFDRPLRELEHVYYTFDTLMDYGAFRDIQRHRMCTQTNQNATIEHGFSKPPYLKEIGFEQEFNESMKKSAQTFEKIYAQFPEEAQYIIPLAYKKRTLITLNLRELHHLIPLRSTPHGHPSYRRVAQLMYEELERVHPLLARYIKVNINEDGAHA